MAITDIFQFIDDIRKYAPQFKSDSEVEDLEPFFRPQYQRMVNLIGQASYDVIKTYIGSPDPVNAILATAADHLQGAMANLLAIPYFIFEASERNNTDNNLFRYQETQQIETYLELAWTDLNFLLDHLEANPATFADYVNTETYKLRSTLFISNAKEFNRYYGAVNSAYFYNNTIYLHEEIQKELIIPRIPDFPTMATDDMKWAVGKAMVYLVLAKACIQLDYTELPKSIRNDIVREVNSKKGTETDVKNTLADAFTIEGEKFLLLIENEVNKDKNSGSLVPPTNTLLETDKFYMP